MTQTPTWQSEHDRYHAFYFPGCKKTGAHTHPDNMNEPEEFDIVERAVDIPMCRDVLWAGTPENPTAPCENRAVAPCSVCEQHGGLVVDDSDTDYDIAVGK